MHSWSFSFAGRMFRAIALSVVGIAAAQAQGSESRPNAIGRRATNFALTDSSGKTHRLEDFSQKPIVVLAFLGTECPLALLYAIKLEAVSQASKDVAVIGIDSNVQDDNEEVAQFVAEQKLTFPVLRDLDGKLADELGATRTPEIFVLDSTRVVRYQGRIDDQFGVQYRRPTVFQRYLESAVEDLRAGRPVRDPFQAAVGCLIGRLSDSRRKPLDSQAPTWVDGVSSIVAKRCGNCHRRGDIGPFPLESYRDTIGWTAMMNEVVADGRMPPWHADPAYGNFDNQLSLTANEKEALLKWFAAGAPSGAEAAPNDSPAAPAPNAWYIKPDQIFPISDKPYRVPAEGNLDYVHFDVDPKFTEDKWIQAVQIKPGNRSVVHHIAAMVFGDNQQPLSGTGQTIALLGHYSPGVRSPSLPDGYAKRVPAGSKFHFIMHYTPNGSEQLDQSEMGVIYTDPQKVRKRVEYLFVSREDFVIPPGIPSITFENSAALSRDYELLSLVPHMHYRGKSFRFDATYPGGQKEVLLDVPRYDFNWQLIYRLKEPKLLPRGTQVRCVANYDNSAGNIANPDPKAEVHWGEKSIDEMMDGCVELAYSMEQTVDATPTPEAPSTESKQHAGSAGWAAMGVAGVAGVLAIAFVLTRRKTAGA